MCLAKLIEDDFWQVHGIWQTSLGYFWAENFFTDFVLTETGQSVAPVLYPCLHIINRRRECLSVKDDQLYVCTYYVLVDKAQVSCVCGDTVAHRTALKNHMQVWQKEQGHDAELTEAHANERTHTCLQEKCAHISNCPRKKLYLQDQLYACQGSLKPTRPANQCSRKSRIPTGSKRAWSSWLHYHRSPLTLARLGLRLSPHFLACFSFSSAQAQTDLSPPPLVSGDFDAWVPERWRRQLPSMWRSLVWWED